MDGRRGIRNLPDMHFFQCRGPATPRARIADLHYRNAVRSLSANCCRGPDKGHKNRHWKTFTYTPKRRLKRCPWYPWSSTCAAQTELPVFTLAGMPGETACPRLWNG